MCDFINTVRDNIAGAMEVFPRGTPRSAVSGAYHAGLLGRAEYEHADALLAWEHECETCRKRWFPKNRPRGNQWSCPVCGGDGLAN